MIITWKHDDKVYMKYLDYIVIKYFQDMCVHDPYLTW